MTDLEYRSLGRSGLRVSVVGLGGNNFGRTGTATETQDGYPVLGLNAQSWQVMRGACRVEIAAPERRSRKMRTKGQTEALDDGLFEALRSLRKRLADESSVPPYVVFHDSTLREKAQRRPATLDEFAAIPGVGHKKLLRYGQRFLDAIRERGEGIRPRRARILSIGMHQVHQQPEALPDRFG